jgi:hypothetical protein
MRYFFAGGELHKCFFTDRARNEVRNILMSYRFIMQKKDHEVAEILDNPVFTHFIIDSGAFSFLVDESRKKELGKYMEGYKRFVKKWHDHPKILWIAEMDIESVVGMKQVKEWYKALRKLSKKVIPIWHPGRGGKEWVRMCKNFPYVAMGKGWQSLELDTIIHMAMIAYRHGAKSHGFAASKLMNEVPFYSVDSTSWLVNARFGSLVSTGQFEKVKNVHKKAVEATDDAILDAPHRWSIKGNDYYDRIIQRFLAHEKFATDLWAKRGIVFEEEESCPKRKRRKKRKS